MDILLLELIRGPDNTFYFYLMLITLLTTAHEIIVKDLEMHNIESFLITHPSEDLLGLCF